MLEQRQRSLIVPDWPAPEQVCAASTTRHGGISQAPFDSFNLALHTGDDRADVLANRQSLLTLLQLSQQPAWLNQIHGCTVVNAAEITQPVAADAAYAVHPEQACVIMTADCLPILLCNRAGTVVAAIHAGWRGLAQEIIAACVTRLPCSADDLLAWLGPAIGPTAFEVGPEVRAAFLDLDDAHARAFKAGREDRWLADIYALAKQQLQQLGVTAIYGGAWCTWCDKEQFFSYRRDRITGRMASVIYLRTA